MDTTERYDLIPETAAEALAKWDAGESVFSVEMGGLGPCYEMAIQGLAFELIRVFLNVNWDEYADEESWKRLEPIIDDVVHRCNDRPWGGFSGAQVGAAQNLAAIVCRQGYRMALRKVADRLIQVNKHDLRSERVVPKL